MERCVICDETGKLHNPKSGFDKIEEYGTLFNRSGILKHLENRENVLIHGKCQKDITNEIKKKKRNAAADQELCKDSKMQKRSEVEPFI